MSRAATPCVHDAMLYRRLIPLGATLFGDVIRYHGAVYLLSTAAYCMFFIIFPGRTHLTLMFFDAGANIIPPVDDESRCLRR